MKYPFLISLPHCLSCVPHEIQSYFALDAEDKVPDPEKIKSIRLKFANIFKELADYFFRIFLCR